MQYNLTNQYIKMIELKFDDYFKSNSRKRYSEETIALIDSFISFLGSIEYEEKTHIKNINLKEKTIKNMRMVINQGERPNNPLSNKESSQLARMKYTRKRLRNIEKKQKIARIQEKLVEIGKSMYKEIPRDDIKRYIIGEKYKLIVSKTREDIAFDLIALSGIYLDTLELIDESRKAISHGNFQASITEKNIETEMIKRLKSARDGKSTSAYRVEEAHNVINSNEDLSREIVANSKYRSRRIEKKVYYRNTAKAIYDIRNTGILSGERLSLYEYEFSREKDANRFENSTNSVKRKNVDIIKIYSELTPEAFQKLLSKFEFTNIKELFYDQFKIFRNCIGRPHLYMSGELLQSILNNPQRFKNYTPVSYDKENIYDQMIRREYALRMEKNSEVPSYECLENFELSRSYDDRFRACKIGEFTSATNLDGKDISRVVESGIYFCERDERGKRTSEIIVLDAKPGDKYQEIADKIRKAKISPKDYYEYR